jgi:hypothetical protein
MAGIQVARIVAAHEEDEVKQAGVPLQGDLAFAALPLDAGDSLLEQLDCLPVFPPHCCQASRQLGKPFQRGGLEQTPGLIELSAQQEREEADMAVSNQR